MESKEKYDMELRNEIDESLEKIFGAKEKQRDILLNTLFTENGHFRLDIEHLSMQETRDLQRPLRLLKDVFSLSKFRLIKEFMMNSSRRNIEFDNEYLFVMKSLFKSFNNINTDVQDIIDINNIYKDKILDNEEINEIYNIQDKIKKMNNKIRERYLKTYEMSTRTLNNKF